MSWWEVGLVAAPELAEAVAAVFHRFAPGGVAMEQAPTGKTRVLAYIPIGDGLAELRRQLDEALGHLSLIMPVPALEEREVPDQDWLQAFREGFQPFRVGQRFVVAPSWANYVPAPGDTLLVIDPGMAFGTGLHPTTQMCLLALERLVCAGMAVLDLGTGSGILAIAAAKLGATSVQALDTDSDAVASARENLAANGIRPGMVSVVQGTLDGIPQPFPLGKGQPQFDLVVANLTANILLRLARPTVAALKPEGALITSGILDEQAAAVIARYEAEGVHLQDTLAREDWRTLVFQASGFRLQATGTDVRVP